MVKSVIDSVTVVSQETVKIKYVDSTEAKVEI